MVTFRIVNNGKPVLVDMDAFEQEADSEGHRYRIYPDEDFAKLDDEFHFDLDVCATASNAKCDKYFTIADDGLAQPWTGRVWCNPPHHNVRPWVEKACDGYSGFDVCVLRVPAATNKRWWQELVEPYRDLERGRLTTRFLRESFSPYPTALLIWQG